MEIGFVCGRFIQLRCLRANGDYDWLVKTIQVGSKNKLFFWGEHTCRQYPATLQEYCFWNEGGGKNFPTTGTSEVKKSQKKQDEHVWTCFRRSLPKRDTLGRCRIRREQGYLVW